MSETTHDLTQRAEKYRRWLMGRAEIPPGAEDLIGELVAALVQAEQEKANVQREIDGLRQFAHQRNDHFVTIANDYAKQKQEIERAMKVLNPSMPESGLEDACRQIKQAAISSIDNCEVLEARLATQEATIRQVEQEMRVEIDIHIMASPQALLRWADTLRAILPAEPTKEIP